jgi:dihydrofolate synthase/folylpolyglutamate synthase
VEEIKGILKELYSFKQDYITKDLEKIIKLSDFLGNPHLNYPVVHIAGTNGKGSVCSLLSSILQENNYNVGLYTSPHILKFNERIKINGKCINDKDIINIYKSIYDISLEIGASFFDITTAIAFKYFSDKKINIAIIETGLGGRLDSTNIVNPILSIITSISEDHTNILGKGIKNIVKEKAGIIKENVPVLIEDTNPHIIELLLKEAKKKSAPFYVNYSIPAIQFAGYNVQNNTMICNIQNRTNIVDFLANKNSFFNIDALNTSITESVSALLGKHQIDNMQLVIFAIILISFHKFLIKRNSIDTAMKNVIKNTKIHFRIENISSFPDKPIILDVAHNPKSISVLVDTLKDMYPEKKWNVIFGVMKDKDIKQMLKHILLICNKLIIVQPQIERAATTKDIQKIALKLGFNNIEISDITTACQSAKLQKEHYVICGSFFIMKEVVEAFKLKDVFL